MLYSLPFLFTALTLVAFTYIVAISQRQCGSKNTFFVLMSLSVAWWQVFEFLVQHLGNKNLIDLFLRLEYVGIIILPAFFYHFSTFFFKSKKILVYLVYFIALIFEFLVWYSDDFINGYYNYSWGVVPSVGYLHSFFIVYIFLILGSVLWGLLKTYHREVVKERKWVLRYLIISTIILSLSAVDFLPKYGFDIYTFGSFFILIFLGLIFYATSKYNLISVRGFLDKLFIVFVLSFLSYIFWSFILYLQYKYADNLFNERAYLFSMIIIPFYTFIFIEIYKKVSIFSKKLFKVFNADLVLNNISRELLGLSDEKAASEYFVEKLSSIFPAEAVAIRKNDDGGGCDLWNSTDVNKEEKEKNKLCLLAKEINSVLVTGKERMMAFIPDSDRSNILKTLDNFGIEIAVPIGKNIMVFLWEKESGDRYSFEEIDFLKKLSDKTSQLKF